MSSQAYGHIISDWLICKFGILHAEKKIIEVFLLSNIFGNISRDLTCSPEICETYTNSHTSAHAQALRARAYYDATGCGIRYIHWSTVGLRFACLQLHGFRIKNACSRLRWGFLGCSLVWLQLSNASSLLLWNETPQGPSWQACKVLQCFGPTYLRFFRPSPTHFARRRPLERLSALCSCTTG